jgi:DNA polymerase
VEKIDVLRNDECSIVRYNSISMTDKTSQIKALNQKLEQSYQTLPLVNNEKEVIPGEGNANAELFFIGEAPGHQEYVERRPFVGRSGQLFRKTLGEVGIDEKSVYITNIIKARPPENRDPSPQEIEAYKSFLNEEIEIVDPVLIVTLGRFSMRKFLPDASISQVHGRLHKVKWLNTDKTLYVLPMYHPAAALRGTAIKMSFVADFKKILPAVQFIKNKKESEQITKDIEDLML